MACHSGVREQGEKLRAVLAAHGCTVYRLSRETGIDASSLYNVANDKRGLGPELANRIARHLGVDITEVLTERPARAAPLAAADVERLLAELAEANEKLDRLLAVTARRFGEQP